MFVLFQVILFIYFVYVVGYTTFFSLAGFMYKSPPEISPTKWFRFCVIIPCYKEDAIIVDTARQALTQNYPNIYYQVVVVADSLKEETVRELQGLPITVIPVHFDQSTKVKSLNKAFDTLSGYDYAIILDADNVMAPDFIDRVNSCLNTSSLKAIQGQRKPKNQHTTLAFLDGVSEGINNHILRQGTAWPGLSASISGSGFIIDFNLVKSKMANMNSVGGFDRELELLLIRDGIHVRYFKEAIVYDEKVSQRKVFGNQRRRWISSQYFYLRKYFWQGILALRKGDWAFFNSAVLRNIQLPRILNIGLFAITVLTLFFLREHLAISFSWWGGLFLIYGVSVFAAIPKEFHGRRMIESIAHLPGVFIQMSILMFRLKGANSRFIHTPHEVTVDRDTLNRIV